MQNLSRTGVASVLAATLVTLAAAPAGAASLGEHLPALRAASDQAFVDAADAALADPAVRQEVVAKASSLTFSAATFEDDALVQILADRARDPGAVERLKTVQGLDPAHYLLARRPVPLATREVTRLGLPLGALLEGWLKAQDRVLDRPKSAYPEAHQARIASLRVDEKAALQAALLTALARTEHPAGVRVLLRHLDSNRGNDRGQLAAVLLGETRSAEAQAALVGVLDDPASPGGLRAAALVGLGKLRNAAALERIAKEAREARGEARLSAVRALGAVANRSGLRAKGSADADALRARSTAVLVELLPSLAGDETLATAAAESLAVVGHASAVPALERLKAQSADAKVQRAADRALRAVRRTLARG